MASVRGNGRIEKRGKGYLMRVNVGYTPEEARALGQEGRRVSEKAAGVTNKRGAEKALRTFVDVVEFSLRTCPDLTQLDARIAP